MNKSKSLDNAHLRARIVELESFLREIEGFLTIFVKLKDLLEAVDHKDTGNRMPDAERWERLRRNLEVRKSEAEASIRFIGETEAADRYKHWLEAYDKTLRCMDHLNEK